MALALFGAQARGPLFQEYSRQLITECHAFWEAGRQLCEAASLTNNPCNLSKHGPDREHCSGVRYIGMYIEITKYKYILLFILTLVTIYSICL